MRSLPKPIKWVIWIILLFVLISIVGAIRRHNKKLEVSASAPDLIEKTFEDAPVTQLHPGETRHIVFDGKTVYGPFRLESTFGISIDFSAGEDQTVLIYFSRTPNNPYWVTTSQAGGSRYDVDEFNRPFCFFGYAGATLDIVVK